MPDATVKTTVFNIFQKKIVEAVKIFYHFVLSQSNLLDSIIIIIELLIQTV